MFRIKTTYYALTLATIIAFTLLAAACSKNEVVTTYEQEAAKPVYVKQEAVQQEVSDSPVPISFDASIGEQATTRSASVNGKADLARDGFSVFAYYLRNKYFPGTSSIPAGGEEAYWEDDNVYPNFMYNQKVIGTVVKDDPDESKVEVNWNYTPQKYWPNETLTDGNGATSENLDMLTFIAYGTHVELATESLSKGASDVSFIPYSYTDPVGRNAFKTKLSSGIVAISRNDYAGEPFLIYDLKGDKGGMVDAKDMDDLVLATVDQSKHFNKTKQNVSGNISFSFSHALSAFGFGVTGVFNEKGRSSGNKIDDNSFIRIEEIIMKVSLPTKAVIHLINQNWTSNTAEEITFRMGADKIAENLSYPDYFVYTQKNVDGVYKTVVDEEATTAKVNELIDEGGLLSYGVGRVYPSGDRIPNNDDVNYYQKVGATSEGENLFYFIPLADDADNAHVNFTFTITYHTLSADPRMPYGLSDVKNVVTNTYDFEGMPTRTEAKNKKFMFNLLLGMTQVNIKGVNFSDKYLDLEENTPWNTNPLYYSFPKD